MHLAMRCLFSLILVLTLGATSGCLALPSSGSDDGSTTITEAADGATIITTTNFQAEEAGTNGNGSAYGGLIDGLSGAYYDRSPGYNCVNDYGISNFSYRDKITFRNGFNPVSLGDACTRQYEALDPMDVEVAQYNVSMLGYLDRIYEKESNNIDPETFPVVWCRPQNSASPLVSSESIEEGVDVIIRAHYGQGRTRFSGWIVYGEKVTERTGERREFLPIDLSLSVDGDVVEFKRRSGSRDFNLQVDLGAPDVDGFKFAGVLTAEPAKNLSFSSEQLECRIHTEHAPAIRRTAEEDSGI